MTSKWCGSKIEIYICEKGAGQVLKTRRLKISTRRINAKNYFDGDCPFTFFLQRQSKCSVVK